MQIPTPGAVPMGQPPPQATPPMAPPSAPAQPTVVVRNAPAAPAAPPAAAAHAAPPAPMAPQEGATEYINVSSMVASQVVGVLVAIDGELEGQVYKLEDGENRLGRASTCNVEIPSKKVSREHAKIIHMSGSFAIAPLSEQNPTLVNDEPVPPEGTELPDGASVRVGRTTLRFRSIAG